VDSIVYKTYPNEYGDVDKYEFKRCNECAELIIIFAITWSLGGNLKVKNRELFSQ
jgi:hypothetical protein